MLQFINSAFYLAICLLHLGIAHAETYVDHEGLPMVFFPDAGADLVTGFKTYYTPYLNYPRITTTTGISVSLTYVMENLVLGDYESASFTLVVPSFNKPVVRGGDHQNARILNSVLNVDSTIIDVIGILLPTVDGLYTFTLDYTGTSAALAVYSMGSKCEQRSLPPFKDSDQTGTSVSFSSGPDYTDQIVISVNITAGQKYYLGYQYDNLYNDTLQLTQQYVSANLSMTLPTGEIVTDFTDYVKSGGSSFYFCKYDESTTITSTWTGSYTTTTSTDVSTSWSSVPDWGYTRDMINENVYYVNVPASTSSSPISSSVLSSQIPSSTESLTSSSMAASSSSMIPSSSEASNIFSNIPSSSDVTYSAGSSSDGVSGTPSSTGPSPNSVLKSVSNDISSSTVLSVVVTSSLSPSSYNSDKLHSSQISSLADSSFTHSMVPFTSSLPNRNVVSQNSSQSVEASVLSSAVTSSLASDETASEAGTFSSTSTTESSVATSSGVTVSTMVSSTSSGSEITDVTSSNFSKYDNTTITSTKSSSGQTDHQSFRTETYTDVYGVIVTTVVPCEQTGITDSSTIKPQNQPTTNNQKGTPSELTTSTNMNSAVHSGKVNTVTGVMSAGGEDVTVLGVQSDSTTTSRASTFVSSSKAVLSEQHRTSNVVEQYTTTNIASSSHYSSLPSAIPFSPESDNGANQRIVNVSILLMTLLFAFT